MYLRIFLSRFLLPAFWLAVYFIAEYFPSFPFKSSVAPGLFAGNMIYLFIYNPCYLISFRPGERSFEMYCITGFFKRRTVSINISDVRFYGRKKIQQPVLLVNKKTWYMQIPDKKLAQTVSVYLEKMISI